MTGLTDGKNTNLPENMLTENGTLFVHQDVSTYPPEFTFVVISILPNVPVFYDRKENRWWTAIADNQTPDIYSRDDLYHSDGKADIYWQPIEFKKADVLFISADVG
jgi:hypothetical protein